MLKLDHNVSYPSGLTEIPKIGSWFTHRTEGTGFVDRIEKGKYFFVIFGHGVGFYFHLTKSNPRT